MDAVSGGVCIPDGVSVLCVGEGEVFESIFGVISLVPLEQAVSINDIINVRGSVIILSFIKVVSISFEILTKLPCVGLSLLFK